MSDALRPLIAAAQRGDRAALDALARCVDRFVRIFSGSLSRRLRQAQGSTVDFVLEGLAEALSRLGEFEYRSDEEFYAWIGGFIRHRILAAAQLEGRRKRAGQPAALGSRDDEVADAVCGVSTVLFADEVKTAVAGAVLALHVEHGEEMEVVVKKVFEGLSWPEIRAELGLSSEKRARTLFAHGVDRLRPQVEARLGAEAFDEFVGL